MRLKPQVILLLILGGVACEIVPVRSQHSENTNSNSADISNPVATPSDDDAWVYMSTHYTQEPSLEYMGYEVKKVKHRIKPKGLTAADVTDAVVQRNGKTIAKLDGMYYGLGNATDFGLFPLLAQEDKQLIVSQTIPRGGRHYVVTFSPKLQVVFDSGDYWVGGEDIRFTDIDKDGVYEICLTAEPYWIREVAPKDNPAIETCFRYDPVSARYLPANHKFPEFFLANVERAKKAVTRNDTDVMFADILEITLEYIFAGKDTEGWEYFDREYNLKDKDLRKRKIKKELKDHPVYKFIYR